jgi:hypothetical protein
MAVNIKITVWHRDVWHIEDAKIDDNTNQKTEIVIFTAVVAFSLKMHVFRKQMRV